MLANELDTYQLVNHSINNVILVTPYLIKLTDVRLKAAVHWVRVSALSAESSPILTWDAMGLRADSARRLSVRAEPLTR